MAFALRQAAGSATAGGSFPATLPLGAPLPGNLLVAVWFTQGGWSTYPSQTHGQAMTAIDGGYYCTDSFGTNGAFFYRKVQPGDSATQYGFAEYGTFCTFAVAEFSGLDLAGSPLNLNGLVAQSNPVAIPVTPSGEGFGVIGMYGSRQNGTQAGLTVNGDTTIAKTQAQTTDGAWPPAVGIIYGEGPSTLGGSMSGPFKDVDRWAGLAFAFPLMLGGARAFSPGIIG